MNTHECRFPRLYVAAMVALLARVDELEKRLDGNYRFDPLHRMIEMREQGLPLSKIAKHFGTSVQAVSQRLKRRTAGRSKRGN